MRWRLRAYQAVGLFAAFGAAWLAAELLRLAGADALWRALVGIAAFVVVVLTIDAGPDVSVAHILARCASSWSSLARLQGALTADCGWCEDCA